MSDDGSIDSIDFGVTFHRTDQSADSDETRTVGLETSDSTVAAEIGTALIARAQQLDEHPAPNSETEPTARELRKLGHAVLDEYGESMVLTGPSPEDDPTETEN